MLALQEQLGYPRGQSAFEIQHVGWARPTSAIGRVVR